MRVLVIILALASLGLVACSGGAASPTAESPTVTPTGPPLDYDGIRAGIRALYAWPSFDTEQFCRSLRDLSDQEAWDVFISIVVAGGYDLPESFGDVKQAVGPMLKEECARMYP